jgi:dephospho-CoA kinase
VALTSPWSSDTAAWRLRRHCQQLNVKECAALEEADFLASFDNVVTVEQPRRQQLQRCLVIA